MPNPQYKNRFKAPAYPVREAGDIIWVYLGPTDKEPAFPHYPMMDVPAENRVVTSVFMDCNWFQVMEGGIDSSHVGILHADVIQAMRNGLDVFHNSNVRHFNTDDNAPALEIGDTEFGFHYAAIRSGSGTDAGTRNVRVTPFILPYSTMIPPGTFQNLYTPVDYGTTQWFIVTFNPDGPLDHDEVMQLLGLDEPGLLDEERRFNANVENRFFQSPEKMKDGSFSGMRGLIWEDAAVQISMGTVIDRTREKVVPADLAVLRARRLFLESLRRMEKGESPIGAELADSSGIFSPEAYVAEGEPWTSLVPGHKLTNHSAGVDAGRP